MKAIVMDFSRVILFPRDRSYSGGLNDLNKELSQTANYNALEHFEINTELIEMIKSNGADLYIYTSDVIQDRPEFAVYLKDFKKIYSAKKLGVSKKESKGYELISKDLGLRPEEIVYIDDSPENVNAASKAGFKAIQYVNNHEIVWH